MTLRTAVVVIIGSVAVLFQTARSVAQTNQTPDDAKLPRFDVASVKENKSLEQEGVFRIQPGRFTVTNLSARWLIEWAYRLRTYEVTDTPAWTDTRYDIRSTFSNGSATGDEVRLMVRRLLAERFALRVHTEQRTLPIYSLRPVRGVGQLGPEMMPSTVDCEAPTPRQDTTNDSRARRCQMFANAWLIHGFGQTMAQLSRVLDEVLTARVVDETGLSGRFDFTVEWGERRTVPRPPNEQSPDDIAALITAFRERLGLKLESERKPVDVVVVEHIEQPDSD